MALHERSAESGVGDLCGIWHMQYWVEDRLWPRSKVGTHNKNAPYPNNTLYALLAVNSNNEVVGEGPSMTFTLEPNESVRFKVNDTHYPNNSGQLTVDWQTNAPVSRQVNTNQGDETMSLSIHPSVGVARVGNSADDELLQPSEISFFLAPTEIGGLPTELTGDTVVQFKDGAGRVRRQGQRFDLFDGDHAVRVDSVVDGKTVTSIEWTVHLANKKSAWYNYSELDGDLLLNPPDVDVGDCDDERNNSYECRGVEWRNDNEDLPVRDEAKRQELIVDFGPRTISGVSAAPVVFADNGRAPVGYPVQFPTYDQGEPSGTRVTTLGELRTDDEGRLIVLGGNGDAAGYEELGSYKGADTWHDDVSDGPVYCTVTFDDGTTAELKAWVISACPDFAPELVNISTLSDVMLDVAVQRLGAIEEPEQANYERDILPILERMSRYHWVSNVQAMTSLTLALNSFDPKGTTNDDQAARENFFKYFREPNGKPQDPDPAQRPQSYLFKSQKDDHTTEVYDFPMMPLNSGSNSVSNRNIVKFLTLTQTQYNLLEKWADGDFTIDAPDYTWDGEVDVRDTAGVGNCVGLPTCPGIEVSWNMQHPAIYEAPYVIEHARLKDGYDTTGLTPDRDECEGGGCEPGDLTKRLGVPWQADYFLCNIQYVNFTDPSTNKVPDPLPNDPHHMKPKPPAYHAYWWPPQAPWDVLTGDTTADEQEASGLPSGLQVNYARGVNTYEQMVEHWFALAYIRDQNAGQASYPYFTETERNHELFELTEVPVGDITGNPADNTTTIPVFFIPDPSSPQTLESVRCKSIRGAKLADYLEQRAFKPIKLPAGGHRIPRSGTRMRR